MIAFDDFFNQRTDEGMEIEALNGHQLYQLIYSEGKESPVVYLTDKSGAKGRSNHNHFTRIYKYLIRSTRISSQDLIDALLIAFEPAKAILVGSILHWCANAPIVFPTLFRSACRQLLESEDGTRTSATRYLATASRQLDVQMVTAFSE